MHRWSELFIPTLREAPADALDYGHPEGTETLRERLADELGRTRGVISDPSRIVIVQGTAQGLDLVLGGIDVVDHR